MTKLREQAETFLEQSNQAIKNLSYSDVDKLTHELNVHQIELEVQNEELRKTQLELIELSNHYVDLFDFAPVGYFKLDKNGLIEDVNLAGANLLGIERCHLIKTAFLRFIQAGDQAKFHHYCRQVFNTKTQQTCELKLLRKDGTHFYAQLSSCIMQNAAIHHDHFRISILDITQRHEAEERARQREAELAHASRLNTMGELVSGITHELNQPLTAITVYAGACLNKLTSENAESDIIEIMKRIMVQAKRTSIIIQRLKAFLQKKELQKIMLNINEVIYNTLGLLDYELKRAQIHVRLDLSNSLPNINGDEVQLQQAIINIIQNAIEAIQATDTKLFQLSIQTRKTTQNNIEIVIADTGKGISSNEIDQIFTPFFTTKINGMGMGLSIVNSIVKAHDGRISVTSNPGEGTRFHLLLPSSE